MTLGSWESGNTRHARDAEDNAELRRRCYAAEEALTKLKAHAERLERQVARLEREAVDGLATIDRLVAAMAEKGAK